MTSISPGTDFGRSRKPCVVTTVSELKTFVSGIRVAQKKLGLVPTMGALHEGHLSLVRASRRECDVTAVTIFVNPTQFGPHEDFNRYPRTLAADVERLSNERVDLVFAPTPDQIYPPGNSTAVDPPNVAKTLEGICRPGHFRGVATIVLKLFQLIPADIAFFGQKDFQQCRVIEQMVLDLNVPITIRRCPIVREADGLAMSSRNRFLSADERQQATAISRCLRAGRQLVQGGERHGEAIRNALRTGLADAGITHIDYVAVVDPVTLTEVDEIADQAALLVAAYVGTTRLIDNCLIE